MNISTSGPHILLFERDQQLTGLLISEFQLAGYECHTARTAVEVFDAIARQPIRLVLVNLAQAAAARREFWVALDTQRRGRGVQVMTFHCSNIANYGPRDPDEHATTMVDLEVDGMMGIMSLVDAIRARVPVGGSNISANTAPRMRATSGQMNSSRPAAQPAANSNMYFANNSSAGRAPLSNENAPQQPSSTYRTQAPALTPIGEMGFLGSEITGRGQPMGTMGNISAQPSYIGGMSSGPGSPSQQTAYSQNASAGNLSTQPSPYPQNMGATNSQVQQPSLYPQNIGATNPSPQQPSFYPQNTSMPNAPIQQSSSYPQNMGGSANAQVQQQSPYSQNMGAANTSTQQSSSYPQNIGATGFSTQAPPSYPQNIGASNATAQPSYTEKIRAVLYPNQRAWSPQGTSASTLTSENLPSFDIPGNPSALQPTSANDQAGSTILQRLANGQTGPEGQWESGLAQLSRMVQEHNTLLENTNNTPAYQIPGTPPVQQQYSAPPVQQQQQPMPAPPVQQQPMPPMDQAFRQFSPTLNPSPGYSAQGPAQPEFQAENLSAQTLRASPIQDLPGERGTNSQTNSESAKRPDVLSRTNYAQQPATALPPLASISAATQLEKEKEEPRTGTGKMARIESQTGIPAIKTIPESAPQAAKGRVTQETPVAKPAQETTRPRNTTIASGTSLATPTEQSAQEASSRTSGKLSQEAGRPGTQGRTYIEQEIPSGMKNTTQTTTIDQEMLSPEQKSPIQLSPELHTYKDVDNNKRLLEKAQADIKVALGQQATFDTNNPPSNALLLDILQSLPPMPAPSQQIQPQVLNGRATRSLGSVLLEGHLVPQNRLEVAQNVQRMLRGVDLNYQLGEILLMFKLLTPDQLLAASLVSYGMITTTQISSLGRIRQELHSMGLEYDLENLLIMFRILTPEQVREVRASW